MAKSDEQEVVTKRSVLVVDDEDVVRFGLKALLETARTAMNRRKCELTLEEEELLKHCFDMTREDRMAYVKRDRRKTS